MKKRIKIVLIMISALVLMLSLSACNIVTELNGDTDENDDIVDNDYDYDYDIDNWTADDFFPNLSYAEEYEFQDKSDGYLNASEAANTVFNDLKDSDRIIDYNDNVEYTMTLIDVISIYGEDSYIYRCDGGNFSEEFAYSYQSGDTYRQDRDGDWVSLTWHGDDVYNDDVDNNGLKPSDVNWWGRYNSINYVLGISNYNGKSFNFTVDDESLASGVAALDPDNFYSAQFGDIIFTFDGEDTINITGKDIEYAETYFRSQYQN